MIAGIIAALAVAAAMAAVWLSGREVRQAKDELARAQTQAAAARHRESQYASALAAREAELERLINSRLRREGRKSKRRAW